MRMRSARRQAINTWVSGIAPIWWRWLGIFVGTLAGLYLLRKGLKGIWEINDFDVMRHGAIEVWRRSAQLYGAASREGRHFLYPPTGAIVLMPLAWLPYHLGGVVFTLVRVVALTLLFRVGIEWSKETGWLGNRQRILWLVVGTGAACWRFLDSEFGNGQINVLLAAFSVGGLWAAFRSKSRWQWMGGFFVGLAAAIKALPLIFFGIFLLHRRWRALAGGVLCVAVLIACTQRLYGPDLADKVWRAWGVKSDEMALSALDTDRVISIPELVVSLAGTGGGRPTREMIRAWWLIEVIALGVVFLLIRLMKRRRQGMIPPLWDAAMLATGAILLSPLVRKAHLALLVFPVLTALVLVFGRSDVRQSPVMQGLLWLALVMLVFGLSIPFEWVIRGWAVNPTLLLALVCCAASLSCARFPSGRTNGS